ncbi:MAG: DUF401 family protein [bacterium]|uniref:DUF401 family protein n=2 Tax=Bacteria candidate phyla TaxID=1783234 RepID=A0A348MKC1_UNCW3|nr:DUF401 family protein [bacterium]HAF07497.1 hypothetical protein [candidate division WOR-3 bacterium]HCP17566.1 hypothetical protein [candidate division WOR-3 bacterium]
MMLFWVKIFFIIVIFVVSLRFKINIGISLLISSLFIGLFFYSGFKQISDVFVKSITSYTTVKTVIIIYSVLLLTNVIKEKGIKVITESLLEIFKDVKYAIIFPPMFIGLLPMPGGALVPSEIVNELGDKIDMKPEEKTFVNYWFRHIWEYFWPLYPGLILTSNILSVPIKEVMKHQFYLTIVAFLIGIFFIKKLKNVKVERKIPLSKSLLNVFLGFLPVLLIVVLILFSKFREEIIVFSVSFFFLIILKVGIKKKVKIFIKSISLDMILLIVGVMVFKDFFSNSEVIKNNFLLFQNYKATYYILLIFIPVLIGIFTGVNQAYVGILLPIVSTIILKENGSVDFIKLTLFYASGFFGVLISPVHLCLSLTREYFKADWSKVYRILFPSTLPILLIPLLVDLIL